MGNFQRVYAKLMTRNKEQSSRHHKTHYAKHKVEVKRKNREHREQIVLWYHELKRTLKCSRCPENHSACLQFHHVDPELKDDAVAKGIRNGWSKKRILKEIAKCIVLCANCHCKEHASEV